MRHLFVTRPAWCVCEACEGEGCALIMRSAVWALSGSEGIMFMKRPCERGGDWYAVVLVIRTSVYALTLAWPGVHPRYVLREHNEDDDLCSWPGA